jgi:uncharacterized protein
VNLVDVLTANLLSPVFLAFSLGVLARLTHSELRFPQDLYTSLSIYLLFALGLKGGVELSHVSFGSIAGPAGARCARPCTTSSPGARWSSSSADSRSAS